MLVFVSGLPGALTEWCEAVIARLAERALGPIPLIHADTLQEVSLGAIAIGAAQFVVATQRPGGRLRLALTESGRNFVAALDDPRLALADLALGRGTDLAGATQSVASSCAALIGCAAAPGALALRGRPQAEEAIATALAIARHLGFPADEEEVRGIVDDLGGGPNPGFTPDELGAWWDGLKASEQQIVSGALAPFIEQPGPGDELSIGWARDLFFLAGRTDERARGPIDITGRAHCLLEGPRIMLPPGAWSLSLTLLFSREAAEHEYLVEVATDHPLASGTLLPHLAARAEIAFDVLIDESTEHPLSIRVSTMRAAFDGVVTVGGARLVRKSVVEAEPSLVAALPADV